jgi:hypothetical protein
MSSFLCDKCNALIIDSAGGYLSGCEHYPLKNGSRKFDTDEEKAVKRKAEIYRKRDLKSAKTIALKKVDPNAKKAAVRRRKERLVKAGRLAK